MKKILVLSFLLITAKIGLACSCAYYEPNFYKNALYSTHFALAVFDTLQYHYENEVFLGQTGYFILADTLGDFNSSIGDTIFVVGQDGVNCSESLSRFTPGDTLFLALFSDGTQTKKDTFNLHGLCGKHYLKIENGQAAGLTISEIKTKIGDVQARRSSACLFCDDVGGFYDFFDNIVKASSHCIAVFHRYDYSYSYDGLASQTGYFELLDTIGNFSISPGNTIVVTGEDGINCGEMLDDFSSGDTLLLALSDGFYEELEEGTFYLKGGNCGDYQLKISNGQGGGLSIPALKEKVRLEIREKVFTLFPNPTIDILNIQSPNDLILNIEVYDMSGRVVGSVGAVNDFMTDIDLSNFKNGLYNVLVYTETEKILRKVIKE